MYNINQLSEKLRVETIQVRAYMTLNRHALKPYIIKENGVTYVDEAGFLKLTHEKDAIKSIAVDAQNEKSDASNDHVNDDKHPPKNDIHHNTASLQSDTNHSERLVSLHQSILDIDVDINSAERELRRESETIQKLMQELKQKEASYLKLVMRQTTQAQGGHDV